MKQSILVLIINMLFFAACAGRNVSSSKAVRISVPGGSYTSLSAAQLHTQLDKKNFVFINVHIPYEGEIAETDAFIPYNEIDKNLDKLPARKNARIILYCRSGRMGVIAAEALVRLGYTNVWNLEGGMIAWDRLGYPLQKKRTPFAAEP